MNARTLVITVGTSLFSSASWKNEGALEEVRNYGSWLAKDYLENPGERRSRGWKTSAALEESIREDPERTAEAFELDEYKPLRYCGEITTLLRVYQKEGGDAKSLSDFLRQRYPKIRLIASADVENSSNVVAKHLQAILRDKLGHPGVEVEGRLRGLALTEILGGFRDYLAELKDEPEGDRVDLLVTGGYKSFSILAGHLIGTQPPGKSWRALYLHEDQPLSLVIEERDERGIKRIVSDAGSLDGDIWSDAVE